MTTFLVIGLIGLALLGISLVLGDVFDGIFDALGREGTVTSDIPVDGFGTVRVLLGGHVVRPRPKPLRARSTVRPSVHAVSQKQGQPEPKARPKPPRPWPSDRPRPRPWTSGPWRSRTTTTPPCCRC